MAFIDGSARALNSCLRVRMGRLGVVLLDRAKSAWKLLGLLTVLNTGFLFIVVATKPFRDSDGHTGWTSGDKAQVVAQLALLVECAMAGLCLIIAPNGEDLHAAVEAFVITCSLGATIFPLIYMWKLHKQNATDERPTLAELENGDQEQGNTTKNIVGNTDTSGEQTPKKKKKKKTEKSDGQVFDNPVVDD